MVAGFFTYSSFFSGSPGGAVAESAGGVVVVSAGGVVDVSAGGVVVVSAGGEVVVPESIGGFVWGSPQPASTAQTARAAIKEINFFMT